MYSILVLIILYILLIMSSSCDKTLNILKMYDIGRGGVETLNPREDNLLYYN